MRLMTISALLALGAALAPADARAATPAASRAASQAWKSSLRAARLNQLQARRASAAAARASARAFASRPKYTFNQLVALRNRNPRAFDRSFPVAGKLLVNDVQLRIAAAQGLSTLNGLLPDTPLIRYLKWRRSLNPERFDFFHPVLGPILEEDEEIRDGTNPTPQPGETTPPPSNPGNPGSQPPGGTPPPGGGGDDDPPPTVPEPTSAILTLLGLGGLGLAQRFASRKKSPRAA